MRPHILVYTPVASAGLRDRLGTPEYSYRFVVDHFRPVLDRLGEVVEVSDPDDGVRRHDAVCDGAAGCLVLSFAPPNRAPTGLGLPTWSVVAWEFDTIPDEMWGEDPADDWRSVLADHGHTIVLSTDSRRAVVRAMGPDHPVSAIPAPLFDRVAGDWRGAPPVGTRSVQVPGMVIDSRDFEVTADDLRPRHPERFAAGVWDGSAVRYSFAAGEVGCGLLVGFHAPEAFGSWSRLRAPWILLPRQYHGDVTVTLLLGAYGANVGHTVTVEFGGQRADLTLTEQPSEHRLEFRIREPGSVIRFHGLRTGSVPGTHDVRSLGVSLCALQIEPGAGPATGNSRRAVGGLLHRIRALRRRRPARGDDAGPPAVLLDGPRGQRVDLTGVVYTSVLNPGDSRKNWSEIVSSFIWRFRDRADVTLVLKLTHHEPMLFFAALQQALLRAGPAACRVVVITGFLDDEQFRSLRAATTYYVNASSAEGLCMPLMEFLADGVPAVTVDHTAMADYIDQRNAFVVSSTRQATSWPHDPRFMLRTRGHRVDWTSFDEQLLRSLDVADRDPLTYQRMSRAAWQSQRDHCGDAVVARQLAEALALPVAPASIDRIVPEQSDCDRMGLAARPLVLYAPQEHTDLRDELGKADYSYAFVMRAVAAMLGREAEVHVVTDADEIAPLCAGLGVGGGRPVVLAFVPPHRVPHVAGVPVVPVFAWEYSTLPSEVWDGNPDNDWVAVLRRCGAAITHSEYAVAVTRVALGRSFPVACLPAPVWDDFEGLAPQRPPQFATQEWRLSFEGVLWDSRADGFAEVGSARPSVSATHHELRLDGVVFTTVLNPDDGRKAWEDLATAFVWAFRDNPAATLVVKIVHFDDSRALDVVWELVSRLAPYRCRLVFVQAFLDRDDYRQLVRASTYVVNSSRGEGQCLPLMEFMSAGTPAVAPDHTAMADYLDADNAFIVPYLSQPAEWPHDFRRLWRTITHQVDWERLCQAYQDAYHLAVADPQGYLARSRHARESLRTHCSREVVARGLASFLGDLPASVVLPEPTGTPSTLSPV